jgi:hypothetical protein
MNCDVCGLWLDGPTDWVKIPACADSVCAKVGLCCYNVVCRNGCQFECCHCRHIVNEKDVVLANDHFYCLSCRKTLCVSPTASVTELYPYIGISVREYIHELMEWNDTPDQINSHIQKLYKRCPYSEEEWGRTRPIRLRHHP